MKVLVIGHPEAVLGFSLAGVNGRAVTTAEEADMALNEALASKENGIVLVTQDVAELIKAGEPSLSDLVLKAIGIKL